jgi:prepilin-type N-terminal cleavage/methylation domain-containing protein
MLTGGRAPASARRDAGFSLVELMVGLVVGLIVAGSALAFTVVTIRSYGENIRSTRLTSDLNDAMNLVVGEMRRAGYDSVSVGRLFTDDVPSSFSSVAVNGSCLSYSYDRGVGSPGDTAAASELRAIRLDASTGTLQMDATSSSAGCGSTGNWVDLTDPRVVQITAFTPVLTEVPFCTVVDQRPVDPANPAGAQEYDRVEGEIRELRLTLTGALRADPSLSRTIENTTRVRADRIEYVIAASTGCP